MEKLGRSLRIFSVNPSVTWILLLSGITVLAIPYVFGAGGDHIVYVNYVAKIFSPSLYPRDFIFSSYNQQIGAEGVSWIIAGLSKGMGSIRGGYYVVFVLMVVARVAVYYYLVSLFLGEEGKRQRRLTLLVILLIVAGFPYMGRIQPFTPTEISLTLVTLAIYLQMKGRFLLGPLFLGLAVYANPTHALLLGPVFILAVFKPSKNLVLQAGIFGVVVLPFILKMLLSADGPFLISDDFVSTLKIADESSVLLSSSMSDYLRLFLTPILISIPLMIKAGEHEWRLIRILWITTSVVGVCAIILSIWPIQSLAEARVERILMPVISVAGIGIVVKSFSKMGWWGYVALLVMFIGYMVWEGRWSENPAIQVPGLAGLILFIWLSLRILFPRRSSLKEFLLAFGISVGGVVLMLPLFGERALSKASSLGASMAPEAFQEGWVYGFRLMILLSLMIVGCIIIYLRFHSNRVPILLLLVGGAIIISNVSHSPSQMYRWVEENTKEEAVFSIPFMDITYSNFRYWAKRSPYVVHEDNAAVLYNREYLDEFNRRKRLYFEDVEGIVKRSEVDYVLSTEMINLSSLRLVHEEQGEYLYKWEDLFGRNE